MLLSVIVTVFNLEKYISTCLKSMINQNLDKKDYEILVINDGSSDQSSDIIAAFEKDHENVTIYTQNNCGLGSARKLGLLYSKGKYIYFMDGDDYLAENIIKQLIETLEKYQLEILGFETIVTKRLDLRLPTSNLNKNFVPRIYNGIEFLGNNLNYRVEVWWYFIKKSFFENSRLTFEDNKFVNDSYFTPALFIQASRVAFLPLDAYRYVKRPNSITSKNDLRHYEKHIKDLEYAIFKMKIIIDSLPNDAVNARLRVKIKQESYVFFSFVRFMKSDLKLSYLKALLGRYRSIDTFPLTNLNKGKTYQSFIYQVLIPIFNRPFLLYPTIAAAKLFFRIKRVIL